jgi:hypothetical protein
MIKANDAKIEDIISKLKTLPRPAPRIKLGRPPISRHRVAAAKMVEAALVKSGLDVAALNKLMAEDRREGRKFLKENLSKTDAAAATVTHQQRVVEALKSSKLVTTDFRPENTLQITEPFYISQNPTSPILQSGEIIPGVAL